MMPIFAGQPSRKAEEVQCASLQESPPVAQEEGSELQPVDLIAYTRPLAKWSRPVSPSTPSEVAVVAAALIEPSSPWPVRYSSLEPTMIVGGLPRRRVGAIAGVSTSLP